MAEPFSGHGVGTAQAISAGQVNHLPIIAHFARRLGLVEIVNRLVFREQPWYLSGEPLTLHHCPCDCGAIVIAIEPELPLMRWPVTKEGDTTRHSAREQAASLLQPHIHALLQDPRKQLPVAVDSVMSPSSGCGKH